MTADNQRANGRCAQTQHPPGSGTCGVIPIGFHEVYGTHLILCDVTVTALAEMKIVCVPNNNTLYMEGGLDQSCELLIDRLLSVEQKNVLAKLIQLF
jgi:hypothetical protein